MDIKGLAVAADELRGLVNGDGADLRLVQVDARAGLVSLELDLSVAGCEACVLPPRALHEMVDFTLKRSLPGNYTVQILDPREVPHPEKDSVGGTPWTIVSPAGETTEQDLDPGPPVGMLEGRTVGFRVDILWRSWDWIVDEWARALQAAGVRTGMWRRWQGLDGEAGEQAHKEYADFLRSVDVAVVGLGNCGSCTSWTIKDAVSALDAGLPTVAVTTAQFEQLGRTLAANYGRPALRLQVLPYPLDTRPEDAVRRIARETFPSALETLGAVV